MNGWIRITFKYENVTTFCFSCGVLGNSKKFCSHLLEKIEYEIVKPYRAWMRAPFRRQTKLIGAKWLGNGGDDYFMNMDAEGSAWKQDYGSLESGENLGNEIQGVNAGRGNRGDKGGENLVVGINLLFLNSNEPINGDNGVKARKRNVATVVNKKRRTDWMWNRKMKIQ